MQQTAKQVVIEIRAPTKGTNTQEECKMRTVSMHKTETITNCKKKKMQQIKLDLSGKLTCTSRSDGGLSPHSSPPQPALQKKGAASPPRGEARSSRWPPAARGLRRVAPRSTAAILWLPPKPKRPLMSFVLVVFPQVECGLCVIVTGKSSCLLTSPFVHQIL